MHHTHDNTYSREELQKMLDGMRATSGAFYVMAARVGHHAFIEFTGLMNEYIKLCQEAFDQGIDFTMTNVHTGQSLPMKGYHAEYLAEKLQCIYGPSLSADAELAKAFTDRILGKHP